MRKNIIPDQIPLFWNTGQIASDDIEHERSTFQAPAASTTPVWQQLTEEILNYSPVLVEYFFLDARQFWIQKASQTAVKHMK